MLPAWRFTRVWATAHRTSSNWGSSWKTMYHAERKPACDTKPAVGSAVACTGNSTDASSHTSSANRETGLQLQLLPPLRASRSVWQYVSCMTLHNKYLKQSQTIEQTNKNTRSEVKLTAAGSNSILLTPSHHFSFEPGTSKGRLDINTSDGELQKEERENRFQGPLLFSEMEKCFEEILV